MGKLYLVTGAAGHLGLAVVKEILSRGEKVRAMILPGQESVMPANAELELMTADVTDPDTLPAFFRNEDGDDLILIHCAAKITIKSKPDRDLRRVNIVGTYNILKCALKMNVSRTVYISSVHAIPEKPGEEEITEVSSFSPKIVHGHYAKSKAAAANLALNFAKAGLNLSIVHPSGIIGPGDSAGNNHSVNTIHAMAEGKIPVGIKGGYDFVDVRDVAKGIVDCADKGRSGECYILSGNYVTIKDLLKEVYKIKNKKAPDFVVPKALAVFAAPFAELYSHVFKKKHILTPYSVTTLSGNGHFSHAKATAEFGYAVRPLEETLRDML